MIRENRYLVLKNEDISKYLSTAQRELLEDICRQIHSRRTTAGRRDNKYVVVADDWPEYETVWSMFERRVDNNVDYLV